MNRQKLGKILKKLRQQKKISTYVMLQKGIRVDTLKHMESGTKNYTIDKFLLYLDILEVDINFKDR